MMTFKKKTHKAFRSMFEMRKKVPIISDDSSLTASICAALFNFDRWQITITPFDFTPIQVQWIPITNLDSHHQKMPLVLRWYSFGTRCSSSHSLLCAFKQKKSVWITSGVYDSNIRYQLQLIVENNNTSINSNEFVYNLQFAENERNRQNGKRVHHSNQCECQTLELNSSFAQMLTFKRKFHHQNILDGMNISNVIVVI